MTFQEAAANARAALSRAGILPQTAALDAELLARDTVGWDRATWIARRAEPASADFLARYEQVIQRRLTREPMAYIRGVQEFWNREFLVTPAVLVPRPDTEVLVEAAKGYLAQHPHARVVEIGTGSGCVAITLALEHPDAVLYAVDISEPALVVARQNAERLGAADRVTFIHGTYLADAPVPVDLIVTNPPYVAERDAPALQPEVRHHEPSVAVFGGADGWRDIRSVLQEAARALSPDGRLMVEIGFGQTEHLDAEIGAVPSLALEDIRTDLQGIPRVAVVRRSS